MRRASGLTIAAAGAERAELVGEQLRALERPHTGILAGRRRVEIGNRELPRRIADNRILKEAPRPQLLERAAAQHRDDDRRHQADEHQRFNIDRVTSSTAGGAGGVSPGSGDCFK